MIPIGIDSARFYTPRYVMSLDTLAKARGIDPKRFRDNLGQHTMSVCPPNENIVTLAANAAQALITPENKSQIDYVMLATESGIDQSKAASVYVHHLLGLSPHCRVIELKQACYSATCGLRLALNHIQLNPDKKVLLIATDIARYGLNTTGESSQGAGAVAMILSKNPRLLRIEPEHGIYVEDAMDFWRPNYLDHALVDGKRSCALYLKLLKETWLQYHQNSQRTYHDHQHFCYHMPVPKLAEKAHHKLALINQQKKQAATHDTQDVQYTLSYGQSIGNCYTASLYLGLLSLLETHPQNLNEHRIGFYSYGSGCTAEFFSGIVQPTYQNVLYKNDHHTQLTTRTPIDIKQYEYFYTYPTHKQSQPLPDFNTGPFYISEYSNHQYHFAQHEYAEIA